MENNKINIAEILKDKPKGTKLYSPIFGDVTFDKVEKDLGEYTIFVTDKGQNHQTFMADGRYNRNGVPVLSPSNEMHDWSKFAWKKGDVLASNDGRKNTIFDGFTDDTYTSFKGKHSLEDNEYIGNENSLGTEDYTLEGENPAKCYINTIEERLGGKLNMETLEIEKPEFKDGDIVTIKGVDNFYEICIFKEISFTKSPSHKYVEKYASYNVELEETLWSNKGESVNIEARTIHFATEEEKQQLFDALAKEGKHWNAEKKQIEEIEPKFDAGDILNVASLDITYILSEDIQGNHYAYAYLKNTEDVVINENGGSFIVDTNKYRVTLANKKERQDLFDAINSKGKLWNSSELSFDDIPVFKFLPFDKVVVRESFHGAWKATLFSNIDSEGNFKCIDGVSYKTVCILPYNNETAKLIGTTNDYKKD